jgi:hypothetical protein
MNPILKRWLNIFGGATGLSGIVFVFLRFKDYANEINIGRFDIIELITLILLAVIYGMANILLARAWWHLLIFFKVSSSFRWAIKIYGLSQLAKYVPGNIFHLAGRQSLGMAAGIPAMSLAKSVIWELILLSIAGSLFIFLTIPLFIHTFSPNNALGLFLSSIILGYIVMNHTSYLQIGNVLFWQIGFLVVSGSVFVCTILIVTPKIITISYLPHICGAFIIAWLLGLLMPGAPAGLGVRELVLYFLLGSQIAQADLLLAIVLSRTLTILGDLIFFWSVMLISE